MAISLQKGGNVNLSKEAPNLTTMVIGLGWDPRSTDGAEFDLDGSAFLLKADGKARSDSDFIFYNNLKSIDGAVVHAGDNRDGSGDGDDEKITINLKTVPPEIDKIKRALVFTFIYEGAPNWSATDGVVTIEIPDQPPVEVRLDQGGNQPLCAIALIENRGGTLQVTKLVDYFSQQGSTSVHQLLDTKYGFGLRWKTGSKD